ncbi:hypothetical protein Ancab_038739 [Ancistrocladus abbreviatus]
MADLIEDFNDVPSNQDDFDQSTIDPSGHPSKKIRSKVWDHLIKIRAENLKDQKAQYKYCNAIVGADPAKGTSCLKNHIDRCKKYLANIELAQRKLALQARFSVDGSKLMMEVLQWSGSTSLRSSKFRTYKGMRVFDVYIQEEKAVSSIDIYAQVGANKSLVIPDLPALVKDDKRLSVRLQGVIGNPMISGISVRKDLLRSELIPVALFDTLQKHYEFQRKELAEARRAIEDLKRENQVKNKECQEAWSSLQELQNQLMCKSMHEIAMGASVVIDFDAAKDGELTLRSNGCPKKTFKFDAVFFGPEADQAHVFEDTTPFATSVLDGYNVCIFAAEL